MLRQSFARADARVAALLAVQRSELFVICGSLPGEGSRAYEVRQEELRWFLRYPDQGMRA